MQRGSGRVSVVTMAPVLVVVNKHKTPPRSEKVALGPVATGLSEFKRGCLEFAVVRSVRRLPTLSFQPNSTSEQNRDSKLVSAACLPVARSHFQMAL